MNDYYSWGSQDLTSIGEHRREKKIRALRVQPGIVLEDAETGWVGAVISLETIGGIRVIGLEDSRGRVKSFPLGFGFLYEGEPVKVLAPAPVSTPGAARISRSGSRVVDNAPARVASSSRLWVEGIHDAELVEKVWGHDLRVEAIAVEPLHGLDDLARAVRQFTPSPRRRLGILVDHLVTGSKETSLVAEAMQVPGAAGNVLILGHPYVDVWQAIKPGVLGIPAWPRVPRSEEWKKGVLKRLGWPHRDREDIAAGWKRMLAAVDSYADLEPHILGPVEQLIDFLTTQEHVPGISIKDR